ARAARRRDRDRLRRGRVALDRAGAAGRTERRAAWLLSRAADAARAGRRRDGARRGAGAVAGRRGAAGRGNGAVAGGGRAGTRAGRVATEHRQGRARPVTPLTFLGRRWRRTRSSGGVRTVRGVSVVSLRRSAAPP